MYFRRLKLFQLILFSFYNSNSNGQKKRKKSSSLTVKFIARHLLYFNAESYLSLILYRKRPHKTAHFSNMFALT